MRGKVTRRQVLQGAAGTVALGSAAVKSAWPAIVTPLDLTVKKIDQTWINVPFRPVPARNMIRELPHWTVFVIYKVTLACGVVGFGETMQFYTWGTVSDEAIARVMNRNAADFLWDDSLGCGLQQALVRRGGKGEWRSRPSAARATRCGTADSSVGGQSTSRPRTGCLSARTRWRPASPLSKRRRGRGSISRISATS